MTEEEQEAQDWEEVRIMTEKISNFIVDEFPDNEIGRLQVALMIILVDYAKQIPVESTELTEIIDCMMNEDNHSHLH
ncbi:MAG: hypothetical protein KAJ03_05010 [Gammaproteobacteria bacterium]|nr:hypothetical protein [Gammaproteobacteria bacterium]